MLIFSFATIVFVSRISMTRIKVSQIYFFDSLAFFFYKYRSYKSLFKWSQLIMDFLANSAISLLSLLVSRRRTDARVFSNGSKIRKFGCFIIIYAYFFHHFFFIRSLQTYVSRKYLQQRRQNHNCEYNNNHYCVYKELRIIGFYL